MDTTIKHILQSGDIMTDQEKLLSLKELSNDIALAKKVIKGEAFYCQDCDDYYLAGSFQIEDTKERCQVCVYQDIINSGGNEYDDGFSFKRYRICPKGHKHLIQEIQRTNKEISILGTPTFTKR